MLWRNADILLAAHRDRIFASSRNLDASNFANLNIIVDGIVEAD